ncbi:MAG: class I SAM-dependent methyltransferase [Ktedonobacteraceae bacterium]
MNRISSREHTALLDSENATEMARLMLQDRFLTQAMGGSLAERQDVATMHRVLDVGCGPGGWVLDVAFAYPTVKVVGIDVSRIMVTYGRAQAWAQGLDNARFQMMDVCEPLAFPDQHFDLINIRLLASVLPTQAWSPLIQACRRLLRPGGILRLTEAENGVTTSAAWERIGGLCMQAMRQSGHSFAPGGSQVAITPMLRPFLVDAGFQDIEERAHVLNFSAGTPAHVAVCQNFLILLDLLRPAVIELGLTSDEEWSTLCHEATIDSLSSAFRALWFLLTAWGRVPSG